MFFFFFSCLATSVYMAILLYFLNSLCKIVGTQLCTLDRENLYFKKIKNEESVTKSVI